MANNTYEDDEKLSDLKKQVQQKDGLRYQFK